MTPGSRIGPYEVVTKLGAGGMGEVYRARDTKLNRDVALKVIPAAVAQDADRMARFQREAQVLAALNHPNIAQIYGMEGAALVMEYVPGDTLRGPLPVEEATAVARQLAAALEYAHEKGIVHRDLKPANIKVTPERVVKVLDFGLAKALEDSPADREIANSPTLSIAATKAGMILGTAAYMSPEQAKGQPADRRSDIFSFGVVLLEMLSGTQAFASGTITETLASVIRDQPAIPPDLPPNVARLLRRCLEKDPRKRLQAIGEARILLDQEDAPEPGAVAKTAKPSRVPWAIAAVILVFAAASSLLRPRPAPAQVTRLTITLPPGQVLAGNGPAISRDGRSIAYTAREADGVTRLFVRDLSRYEASVVPGSEGATGPFFSPDGTRIAFFARGKLMTALLSGGPPTPLMDASYQPFGGTWGDDDAIVCVPALSTGLLRVPSTGGKPEQLTAPDNASKGYAHVWPQFLGGGSLLFTIWGGINEAQAGASLLPPRAKDWTTIVPGPWATLYARSGHLLMSGEHGIRAVSYDLNRPLRVQPQTYVVEDIVLSPGMSKTWFALSDNGALVYVPGDLFLGTLAWVDRQGNITPITSKPESFADPTLSPDGTKAIVEDQGIWIVDLRRGTRSRVTLDNSGMNAYPAWNREGTQAIFASNRGGDWDIYSAPGGGAPSQRVLARKGNQFPLSVAPDGTLLFIERSGSTADLWTLKPDGTAVPFLVSAASKVGGQFSPNGQLVSYTSDETGRDEVYVRSFARPDEVAVVSTEGGRDAKWSLDGKEIFYRRGDAFFAASVTASPLAVSDSRKLFEMRAAQGRSTIHAGYSVGPDGRFLVVKLDARAIPTQINVVLNFFEELKLKVPTK